MKAIKPTLILVIVLFFFPFPSTAWAQLLQSRIDEVPENSVIHVDGIYNESIIIAKPISLEGTEDTKIVSCTDTPSLLIQGKGVTVKNITVEKCDGGKDVPAIYVTGNEHTLNSIHVRAMQTGIQLDKASHITIINSLVDGYGQKNGIDLWESTDNLISNTDITHARDGIYLENSNHNVIEGNSIEQSRYGMHLMFSDDVVLNENHSEHNVTGAMVMEANRTTISNNTFSYNSNNVNAQGLLLYDANRTNIFQNTISYNRVGIYVEKSEQNKLYTNRVQGNFIGIQLKNTNNQAVQQNDFIGNVVEAQAVNSSNNQFATNFWDSSVTLDTTGKGISSIPYRMDPFFLTLTSNIPEYQVFFQAPGMFLLQKLLQSPDSAVLTDWNPVVSRSLKQENRSQPVTYLVIMSVVMVALSILLFLIGRKRI